mmetsp:Transcript_77821/g.225848  ORF Transcript_77821/g.225848 Transcript_77821/m.225848 type:complete len:179 (-) Transcript_77821:1047-1583(-)
MSRQKNVVSQADRATLEEHYEFVPSSTKKVETWQERMSQRYMDGLYKEFALADLSRPGQLGLRWRTRQEVMTGRGEQSCGNKRCTASHQLVTLEVPFSYSEKGVAKKELVKLRLCPECRPLVHTSSQKKKDRRRQEDDSSPSAISSSSSSSNDDRQRKRKSKKKSKKGRKRRKRDSEK